MKKLTAKQAAQHVLDGGCVKVTYDFNKDEFKKDEFSVIESKEMYPFHYIDYLPSGEPLCFRHFEFNDFYTYEVYEKPKSVKDEKKYRWLLEDGDEVIVTTQQYLTLKQAISLAENYGFHTMIIARLDCLDDLKKKEYYEEDF